MQDRLFGQIYASLGSLPRSKDPINDFHFDPQRDHDQPAER